MDPTSQTLVIALVVLVGELAVRVGYNIRKSADHERRIERLEASSDKIFAAIRDLRELIVNGEG